MNPQDSQIHFCTVFVVMGHEGTLGAVEVDRPAPGEELNAGPPTEPRQAATVILLRGGDERLEVLLVQRNPASRFMGGAWVFPGGASTARRTPATRAARGVREVAEEAGVALPDPSALSRSRAGSRPPRCDPLRHALLPRPRAGRRRRRAPDGGETVGAALVRAGRRARRRTRAASSSSCSRRSRRCEQLRAFATAAELLAWADGRDGRADRAAGRGRGRGRAHRAARGARLSRLRASRSP